MITRGKESEVAYIAGLFDGEGNINIYKVERTSSKGPVYDLTIAIYSTNREVIDWLYGLFGGYVQTKNHLKNSGYKSHWKECYSWRLSSNQAQDFLRLVYPYLRIKKSQADIAIEFQEVKRTKNGQFVSLTTQQLACYDSYYMKLRQLIDSPRWQRNSSVAAKRFRPQRLIERTPETVNW